MAINLEQWDPNIKSAGVQQNPAGAYRNPEAVIPDWKSITAGWRQMGQNLVSGVKEISDAQVTVGELAKQEREKKAKELEDIIKKKNIENSKAAEDYDAQGVIGLIESSSRAVEQWYENQFKRQDLIDKYGEGFTYADMDEKDKLTLQSDARELGVVRDSLGRLAVEYRKNNNINYTTLVKNPKVAAFLNIIMGERDAVQRIEKRDGENGVVYLDKDGNEQFMAMRVINENVGIYNSANEETESVNSDLEDIVGQFKPDIDDIIDGKGDWEFKTVEQKQAGINALTKQLEEKIIGGFDENGNQITQGIFANDNNGYVRQFIFNNLLGGEYTTTIRKGEVDEEKVINRRFTELDLNDPAMVKRFNDDLMEYINRKFTPVKHNTLFQKEQDTETVFKHGDRTFEDEKNLNAYKKVNRAVTRTLNLMASDAKDVGVEPITDADEFKELAESSEFLETMKPLKEMDRDIWDRIIGSGKLNQDNFNAILNKAKGKQTLTDSEQLIVDNYKKYTKSWDPKMEPHNFFEGTWEKSFKGSTLDRNTKKVYLYSDNKKSELVRTIDLTTIAGRRQLTKYLVGSSGVGADANMVDNYIDLILNEDKNKKIWGDK